MTDGKSPKETVNYSVGHPGSRCGICEHYIQGGACELVAGKINPAYWCELFEKRQKK